MTNSQILNEYYKVNSIAYVNRQLFLFQLLHVHTYIVNKSSKDITYLNGQIYHRCKASYHYYGLKLNPLRNLSCSKSDHINH